MVLCVGILSFRFVNRTICPACWNALHKAAPQYLALTAGKCLLHRLNFTIKRYHELNPFFLRIRFINFTFQLSSNSDISVKAKNEKSTVNIFYSHFNTKFKSAGDNDF
jgi:hypothetical protein